MLIAAFEGWNDAGGAATAAVHWLATEWNAREVDTIDPEEYHDFQVNRPVTSLDDDGERRLSWPVTSLSVALSPEGRSIVFAQGVEPSLKWRTFCDELLTKAEELNVGTIVCLGALLADAPHSRPIPVQATSDDTKVQALLDIETSEYEGPSGIVGVLAQLAQARGMHALSIWAAVPHYVAQPPSPKATLALLGLLEDVVGERIATGDLDEDARAWQQGVDELAAEDPEISEYVRQLEEAKDTAELPEASGEAIAREFERFLRRRGDGEGPEAR
ncbi:MULTISPECIES: PAC2 family protein [unclassified Pseudactinotalea]|uniref:PAC2 family protein n=1 Tax=unclassified Pseudactinotalea TaxID=2649176 RepID=UPI00128E7C34|nr:MULTISPECIES: PAC2 family protein [unclassified Pseudactinotalea]MPV49897.1 PAC2 family protein [Pseudactinotalea sp. HY160]QGH70962.1 PAC2 family protein [Pseudactinotalea sp. HY158]